MFYLFISLLLSKMYGVTTGTAFVIIIYNIKTTSLQNNTLVVDMDMQMLISVKI